ncbi:unnamed protein product [Sphagnum troendelagicum]
MKRQSFCKESFVFLPSVQASAGEHPAYHQRRPLTEMPKPSSREPVSWNNLVSTISRSEDFAISREQKHKTWKGNATGCTGPSNKRTQQNRREGGHSLAYSKCQEHPGVALRRLDRAREAGHTSTRVFAVGGGTTNPSRTTRTEPQRKTTNSRGAFRSTQQNEQTEKKKKKGKRSTYRAEAPAIAEPVQERSILAYNGAQTMGPPTRRTPQRHQVEPDET